jgi:hypothetical protein
VFGPEAGQGRQFKVIQKALLACLGQQVPALLLHSGLRFLQRLQLAEQPRHRPQLLGGRHPSGQEIVKR